jgi:carboxylesterase
MSTSAVDASPYDLAPHGGDGRSAALCLHGLTGTPYEVRPLAEALAARGLRARGPVLPGHDSTPEALARVPFAAWLAAARQEFEQLRAEHDRVFVAGLSMGGLLALALASEGRGDALAVVGVPLRLRPVPLVAVVPIAKYFHRFLPKREGSDIQDPAARARHPGYKKMPLASVHELMKLQRVVIAGLSRVTAPILVAHGAFDRTANTDDAHRIAGEVSSDERRLLLLERSGHVVPVDYDGPRLANAVADFFTLARLR